MYDAAESMALSWGIYRNIPFALLGLLVIVLFYRSAKEHKDQAFRWMWLTIVLSVSFYIPVVLWADTIPMIGMQIKKRTENAAEGKVSAVFFMAIRSRIRTGF